MNTRPASCRVAAGGGRRQRGFTLAEAAVATAIMAAAAGAAMQGLPRLESRQRVAAAAAEFETDVQHARSLAVLRGAPVRLEFVHDDRGPCYVIHAGAAGDCTCRPDGQATCRGATVPLRSVALGGRRSMSVAGNLRSLSFDPAAGTVTPAGTLRFTATDGSTLHQVVNIMGRVRTCSPRGEVAGHRRC